jgi:hypothetical protein
VQNPGSKTRGPALLLEFIDEIEYIRPERIELHHDQFVTGRIRSSIAASLLSLIP